jgi:hypothetical protein
MAIDLHMFTNRDGKFCVSMTDSEGVRSRPAQVDIQIARVLTEIAVFLAENAGRADGKSEEEVKP